jgi:hypothetical protein
MTKSVAATTGTTVGEGGGVERRAAGEESTKGSIGLDEKKGYDV